MAWVGVENQAQTYASIVCCVDLMCRARASATVTPEAAPDMKKIWEVNGKDLMRVQKVYVQLRGGEVDRACS